MKVAVVCQREFADVDFETARRKILTVLEMGDVEELYVGFTDECAPVATFLVQCAVESRQNGQPLVTAVVPHKASGMAAEARHGIDRADRVLEFAFGEGQVGYNKYLMAFPKLVWDCGEVVVFWDGYFTHEPWGIVGSLRVPAADGTHVAWEHVDIEGVPPPGVLLRAGAEAKEARPRLPKGKKKKS
jgi:hypothetical protein